MDFASIEAQMLVLALCIVLGFAARKLGIMNEEFDGMLSRLVLSVTLPCMIIASVITCDTLPDQATIETIFFYACASFVIVLAIAFIVPYTFRLKPSKRGTYSFMMAFGNVGFIGFPVLGSIFGQNAILYGAIFNIPFNFLIFTVGIMMLSEQEGSFKDMLALCAKNLKSPALLACVAALILALLNVTHTGIIGDAMDTIGSMTTPAALLIIGSSLAKVPIKTMVTHFRTYIMAAFKLIIIPVVVWAIFRNFVTDPLLLGVLVITSGMPVATNGTMLCIRYGGDLNTIIRGTFVTTVLSMVTIPIIAMLVV